MDLIIDGFKQAIHLITTGNSELFVIVLKTLKLCLSAVTIAMIIGIPLGILLGMYHFPGRRLLLTLVHLGMGLPPVVAGLTICIFFWRSGPFGELEWIYTQRAVIIAQVLVALPLLIGLTNTAFESIDRNYHMLLKSMGATRLQTWILLIKQARFGVFSAIIAGLGRVFSEVGAAMMVGANIVGDTQILTTAIVSNVSMGKFELAIALSMILLSITFSFNAVLTVLQKGGKVL